MGDDPNEYKPDEGEEEISQDQADEDGLKIVTDTESQEPMEVAEVTIRGETSSGSRMEVAEEVPSSGEKRHLSLEALFQAAHSELENISKEKLSVHESRTSEPSAGSVESDKVTWLEMGNESGATYLVNTGGVGGPVIKQVQKIVRLEGEGSSGESGRTLISVPHADSSSQVIHVIHGPQGSVTYEVQSADIIHQNTSQNIFINRARSLDETATAGKIRSITQTSPNLLMVGKSTRSAPNLAGVRTTIGVGGRKRKHPQKPGKHICPYCNRGCAKPSVLKKHIRAHTGERPFPCTTCGFAFKTKSNLYKHCKSRWHLLKVGLVKDPLPSSSSTESQPRAEDISDDDDEDDDDEDDDEDGSFTEELPTQVSLPEVTTPKVTMRSAFSLDSAPKGGQKRPMSVTVEDNRKQSRVTLGNGQEPPVKKVQSVRLQSGGMMIDRQPSTSDDTSVIAESQLQNVINITPQSEDRSASSIPDLQTPVTLTPLPFPVSLNYTIHNQNESVFSVIPSVVSSLSAVSSGETQPTSSLMMSPLQLPIKVTPSVQISPPRKALQKSLSTGLGGSAGTFSPPSIQPKLSIPISRSASLHAGGMSVDITKKFPEKKQISPEKVMERISQLISTNQQIVSTPMAEPPRKRILRQHSSVPAMQRQSSVPVLLAGHGALLPRSASMTDRVVSIAPAGLPETSLALSRSMSLQTPLQGIVSHTPITPHTPITLQTPVTPQEPYVLVQSVDPHTSVPHQIQPIIQIPSHLLGPTSGPEAPKEIKIQFKLPKTTAVSSLKMSNPEGVVYSSSKSLPETVVSSVSLDKPVSNVELNTPSTTPSAKTQLEAMLQGHGHYRPEATKLSIPLSNLTPKDNNTSQKYVCGTCWETFISLDSLKSHQANKCQTEQPKSTASYSRLKQVLQHGEVKSVPSQNDQSPLTPIPGTREITFPLGRSVSEDLSKVSQKVTVDSLEGISTEVSTSDQIASLEPRRHKRVLQRQKNIVLEMVDPRISPKKGRPKGAKNVQADLEIDSTSSRPLLQRSQSTIETAHNLDEIPGELRGETPQALWKLKLKGRLLMKRSMSVERMLSQEKSQIESSKSSKDSLSPKTMSARQAMLFRSKSYDESALAKQKPVKESQQVAHVRERLLSKLSKSCNNLLRVQSMESEDGADMNDDPGGPELSSPKPIIPLIVEEGVVDVFTNKPLVYSTPNNEGITVILPATPTYTPHFLRRKLGQPVDHQVPVTLSIPVNIAHKVPGLLHEANLSPDGSDMGTNSSVVTKDALSVESKDTPETGTQESVDSEKTAEITTPIEHVEERTKIPVNKNDEAKESEQSSQNKKRNICTLHTIQMAGLSKPVKDKIQSTLLLLGHSYPSMKTTTMSTFCCIHKTQPMYVPLQQGSESTKSRSRLSMYSNWRAAPYNPNPMGLSSTQLLNLYQTHRYDCEPRFLVADGTYSDNPPPICEVTHSNDWSLKEEEFKNEPGDLAEEARVLRKTIKLDIYPDVQLKTEEIEVQEEIIEAVRTESSTSESDPLQASLAKDRLKEVLTTSDKPKRIPIFDGGYKSMEEYIYIRGRGKGKYVCEKCGIRCKKPSMLKKHIRTHTDIRPYQCRYCNFSFKTKGNLTKHMKSKSHHKLCVDMGIHPVPTSVDDDCIVDEVLQAQQSGVIYDTDPPAVGHMEEVGSLPMSDDDEDDDDDDGDEEGEENEEWIMTEHLRSASSEEWVQEKETSGLPEDWTSGKMKPGASEEVQLLEVEVVTHPSKETSEITEIISVPHDDGVVAVDSSGEENSGKPREALDKEIAATLLDLSKVPGDEGDKEAHRKRRERLQKQAKSVEKVLANESSITKAISMDTATSGQTTDAVEGPVKAKDFTLQWTFRYLKSHNSYAKKIAMLQAANRSESNEEVITIIEPRQEFSGFVPPLVGGESEERPVQMQESGQPRGNSENKSENLGPIVGQFILRDLPAEEAVAKSKSKELSAASLSEIVDNEIGKSLSVDKADIQKQILAIAKIPVSSVKTPAPDINVQYVEGEDHAPCEIIPIPIGGLSEEPTEDSAGKYGCTVCYKVFERPHHLNMHKNVHLLERPYKCVDCTLSFQSRMLLDKHQQSDRHQQQVDLLQRMGSLTSEDPRPHKCEECNIAFRIQGHLARHLRSKMHISRLEALGKVPIGTYDQVEYDHAILAAAYTTPATTVNITTTGIEPTNKMITLPKVSTQKPKLSRKPSEGISQKETKAAIAKITTRPQTDGRSDSDEDLTTNKGSHIGRTTHDTSFAYQKTEEYEKLHPASNERVTVEIKSEPIEFGEIIPKVTQKQDGELEEGEGTGVDGPHKCGICSKTFKEIGFLKRHLVSHAELRPYVCEYCDAGFTTAQSLKFHLRTHTQDRPYLCGHCGSTFRSSDYLQMHFSQAHCGAILPEDSSPVTVVNPGAVIKQPSVSVVSKQPQSQHVIISSAKSASASKPVVLQSQQILTGPSQYLLHIPGQGFIQLPQNQGHINPGQIQLITTGQGAASSTADLNVIKYADNLLAISTGSQVVTPSVQSVATTTQVPTVVAALDEPRLTTFVSSESKSVGVVQENHALHVDTDDSPSSGDMIELDLNSYEVQECVEQGPDGEERTVYMLMMPESKQSEDDVTNTHQMALLRESPSTVTMSEEVIIAKQGDEHIYSHPTEVILRSELDQNVVVENVHAALPQIETDTLEISTTLDHGHYQFPSSGIHLQKRDLESEDSEQPRKWRVIEATDGNMSLSPIFDNEDPTEGQGQEDDPN